MEVDESRTYHLPTPLGVWTTVFTDAGLRELRLPGTLLKDGHHPGRGQGKGSLSCPVLRDQEGVAGRRLCEALAVRLTGKPVDLPWDAFDLSARPPFFTRAWRALYRIPFGEVRTYGQIAAAAG
jgi:hypothetical protein